MKMKPTEKPESKKDEKPETKKDDKPETKKDDKPIVAPAENSVTCPDCMTMFNTTTGDIIKRKDAEPTKAEEPTLEEETDYGDFTPPLFDKHNVKGDSEDENNTE